MQYGSMCLIPRFTAEEWPDIEYEFLPASNTQVEENMYKLVHVNALPITSGQCGTHMGISCYPFSSCGGAGIYFHIHMNNIWPKIWKSVDYMSSTYLISRKQHVDFKIFCIYLKLKSHGEWSSICFFNSDYIWDTLKKHRQNLLLLYLSTMDIFLWNFVLSPFSITVTTVVNKNIITMQ